MLAIGNGPGVPAAYLLVAVVLLLFSVGYAAMSRPCRRHRRLLLVRHRRARPDHRHRGGRAGAADVQH
ncbi:hypothetical protein ACRAWF_19950 [Streptomyces sp. L7]